MGPTAQIRIAGPAAVAVLVLAACAFASVSRAGTYYWCRPAKKGEYLNSTCSTKSAKHEKGKYELKLVATCEAEKRGDYTSSSCTELSSKPHKGTYETTGGRAYTSTGGSAELSTPAFGSGAVVCTASAGAGEITGPKTGVYRLTFTGCSFEGLTCESAGPNSTPSGQAGVIITSLLVSRLVDSPETISFLNAETNDLETRGPAVGEVWEELKSFEHEPYLAEFACGGIVFLRVQGEDTGVVEGDSVNDLTLTHEIAFEAGRGADGLLSEALTEAGWVGPAPSIEEAGVLTVRDETPTEVCAATEIRSGVRQDAPLDNCKPGLICNKFAFCEPTLTPGVQLTVWDLEGSAPYNTCTAGPLVTKGAEVFLLTAGHCFNEKEEGEGPITQKAFSAYPKELAAKTEKLVGEHDTYFHNEEYDVGEIKIDKPNSEWLLRNNVAPTELVEWADGGAKPKIVQVVGRGTSKVGEESCQSGAKSGLHCGVILASPAKDSEGTANLVETSASAVSGDSGAPVFKQGKGGVDIQGILTDGGAFTDGAKGYVDEGSSKITALPENVCKVFMEMEARWKDAPKSVRVPVEGPGIPPKTTATGCEVKNFLATVSMSKGATTTPPGNPVGVTIGHKELMWYEPMSRIEGKYPGQSLVVK